MKESTKKKIRYAAYVLMLGVILAAGLGGRQVLARYTTASGGSDGARVAAWETEVESEAYAGGEITANGEEASVSDAFYFTVSADSEVASRYGIKISLEGMPAYPKGLTAILKTYSVDGETKTVTDTRTSETGEFAEVGTFGPSEAGTKYHSISFRADTRVPGNEAGYKVNVGVKLEQID